MPVRASHTFAVLSQLPVTIRVPSGLNATLDTPVRVPLQVSEARARSRVPHLRRLVVLPVTMRVPSGLNDTLITQSRVPLEVEQGRARPRVPHLRRLVRNCR